MPEILSYKIFLKKFKIIDMIKTISIHNNGFRQFINTGHKKTSYNDKKLGNGKEKIKSQA